MKREPILNLIRSIWDALTNPLTMTGGLAVKERLTDVCDLITDWKKGIDPLEAFKPKYIQGLYHYHHYEREDGAWYQVSIDSKRLEVTFLPHEGGKFRKYKNLDELRKALTK